MKPGISRTGRPSPCGTPPPRHTELRNSAAASTPAKLSRQRGGKCGSGTPTSTLYPIWARDDHRRTGSTLAPMRAATIVDGRIEVADHPDPEPQDGQLLVRVRAAGLNGADMMQLAGKYPAPPGVPAGHPGPRARRRGRRLRPPRGPLRARRSRDGDRRRRRPGGVRRRPRAHRDARSGGARLDRRGRRPGGLHHRPRRALHAGRADVRRAAARARRRRRRRDGRGAAGGDGRRARDRDGAQRAGARADRRARRPRDRSGGLRRAGRVRRHPRARRRPQPVREPRLARDRRADLHHRRRRGGERPRSTCAS